MSDPARAVFSIFGKGTAVAISEDLLVTCEHVVKDAKEVTLFSHHPVFEGETDLEKRKAKGKVLATSAFSRLACSRSGWVSLPEEGTFPRLEHGVLVCARITEQPWTEVSPIESILQCRFAKPPSLKTRRALARCTNVPLRNRGSVGKHN